MLCSLTSTCVQPCSYRVRSCLHRSGPVRTGRFVRRRIQQTLRQLLATLRCAGRDVRNIRCCSGSAGAEQRQLSHCPLLPLTRISTIYTLCLFFSLCESQDQSSQLLSGQTSTVKQSCFTLQFTCSQPADFVHDHEFSSHSNAKTSFHKH